MTTRTRSRLTYVGVILFFAVLLASCLYDVTRPGTAPSVKQQWDRKYPANSEAKLYR